MFFETIIPPAPIAPATAKAKSDTAPVLGASSLSAGLVVSVFVVSVFVVSVLSASPPAITVVVSSNDGSVVVRSGLTVSGTVVPAGFVVPVISAGLVV